MSSRAVRASLQSQPVLYNAAGKKIKEQVLNQRFKVQGFNVAGSIRRPFQWFTGSDLIGEPGFPLKACGKDELRKEEKQIAETCEEFSQKSNPLRARSLCGECLYRLSRHAFAQHLIQQGFIDELSGVDRLVHFLRDAGGVNQELVAFDAIFAVRAKQLQ